MVNECTTTTKRNFSIDNHDSACPTMSHRAIRLCACVRAYTKTNDKHTDRQTKQHNRVQPMHMLLSLAAYRPLQMHPTLVIHYYTSELNLKQRMTVQLQSKYKIQQKYTN